MPIPAAGEGPFKDLFEAHLADLQRRRLSEATATLARQVLPRLFAFLDQRGLAQARDVREADLEAFARKLREAPRSPWTLSTYLATVRRFFRFLAASHVLLVDPAEELVASEGQRLPRACLSAAQACRLMTAPDAGTPLGLRDRAVLELLYGSGIRVRECEGIDVTDVHLAEGSLLIRKGKGRRERLVPITACALRALDSYLKQARPRLWRHASEPALFLTRGGRRLRVLSLERLTRRHARPAGVDVRVTPHLLRHVCATHLLRGGADIRHVQRLLGHADLQTTALYTRVDTADLARVLERSHPRERRHVRKGL